MNDLSPTVLIVTEHGLNTNNLQNTKISDYELITHYCRKDHKMGGVAIYIQSTANLEVEAIDISDKSLELVCETALMKITHGRETFYILGIYRPPGRSSKIAVEIMSNILTSIRAEGKLLMLIGDVNMDRLVVNADNSCFEDELRTFGVKRLPLPATRITSHSKTSIDCICTNITQNRINFTIVQAGIADHTGQMCTIKMKNNVLTKKEVEEKRIFSKQNLESLKLELATENWENVHNATNAEHAYNSLLTTIKLALDHICPKKKITLKPRNKLQLCYDDEAKKLKEDFLSALKRYQLTESDCDRTLMTTRKKSYDMKLRHLKRNMTADHINQSDNKTKAIWNTINKEKQSTRKKESKMQLEIGGNIIDNPNQIVEHLNEFFSQIADSTLKENRKQLKYTNITHTVISQQSNSRLLSLAPTNIKEVITTIQSLKSKLSCGVDEIPSKVVKHCAQQLAPPLVSVINKSFSTGQFPSALKIAKIYPKHKKGSFTKPENYRPISLIPTLSKVVEKIAMSRMLGYLVENDLIVKNQHGFLKGRSTTSALVDLIENIIDNLEEGKHVSAVLLDYSKAFDCLGHDLILKKLSALGIEGLAKGWVESYLKDRRQIVEIQQKHNGNKSTFRSKQLPINRGVPQGSVIGPFLFILFTNDFTSFINNDNIDTTMYADDTSLLVSNYSSHELVAEILSSTDKALQYCLQNDLAINPSKTTLLNFSRRRDEIPNIPDITTSKTSKLLGLTIDTDLSWSYHINSLTKKLSSGIYVLKRMMWIGGIEAAKTAYYALVESHIRYGLIIWGGTSETNIGKILVLQKKAIRTLAGLGPKDSCRGAFKSLKLLTVPALYILTVVIHTKQLDLPRNRDFHNYYTRRAADYNLPSHHTTKYSEKPSYIGRKIINLLPQSLKNINGNELRSRLHNWLVERPVYSLKELFELL